MLDPLRILLRPIWDLILPIPMPWRMLIIFCGAIPAIYWLSLRGLPWFMAKSSYLLLICAELLAKLLLLPEYTFTQYLRQQKRKPPSIIYSANEIISNLLQVLHKISLLLEELLKKALKRNSIIQKEWVTIPVIILLCMWFFRPILGEFGENTIGRLDSLWSSFEYWVLYGDGKGSAPRFTPDKFINNYFYLVDKRQISDGWKLLT